MRVAGFFLQGNVHTVKYSKESFPKPRNLGQRTVVPKLCIFSTQHRWCKARKYYNKIAFFIIKKKDWVIILNLRKMNQKWGIMWRRVVILWRVIIMGGEPCFWWHSLAHLRESFPHISAILWSRLGFQPPCTIFFTDLGNISPKWWPCITTAIYFALPTFNECVTRPRWCLVTQWTSWECRGPLKWFFSHWLASVCPPKWMWNPSPWRSGGRCTQPCVMPSKHNSHSYEAIK